MKHIYTTSWHQFNWEYHHIHVTCDQATWIPELYMSDKFQVPAALSPEERRADNPSPPSLALALSLSLWRSYKTSSLNQEKYNTANQSIENVRSRQTGDLEAPGRYKWRNNFLNSATGDRISITGAVYSSMCLQSLMKLLFYVIALVLWSSDHLLQNDIVTYQWHYDLTLLALKTSKSPAAQSVWLSKLESGHSFSQLMNNAGPKYNGTVRSQPIYPAAR